MQILSGKIVQLAEVTKEERIIALSQDVSGRMSKAITTVERWKRWYESEERRREEKRGEERRRKEKRGEERRREAKRGEERRKEERIIALSQDIQKRS